MNAIIVMVGFVALAYIAYLMFTQPQAAFRVMGKIFIGIFTVLFRILQGIFSFFSALFRRK